MSTHIPYVTAPEDLPSHIAILNGAPNSKQLINAVYFHGTAQVSLCCGTAQIHAWSYF